jgi:hypothetical protein
VKASSPDSCGGNRPKTFLPTGRVFSDVSFGNTISSPQFSPSVRRKASLTGSPLANADDFGSNRFWKRYGQRSFVFSTITDGVSGGGAGGFVFPACPEKRDTGKKHDAQNKFENFVISDLDFYCAVTAY